MIIYANADGTVQSSPSFIPCGSGGIPVQVIAPHWSGWTCTVGIMPPTKLVLDSVVLSPTFGGSRGVWEGRLPAGTADKPGSGEYQLQFTSASGEVAATLTGTYKVQNGVVDAFPEDMGDLSSYSLRTLAVLLSQFSNKYTELTERMDELESGTAVLPNNIVTTANLQKSMQDAGGYELRLLKNVLSWGISGKVLASVIVAGIATSSASCFWTQDYRDKLADTIESVPIVADSSTEAAELNTTREELVTALRGSGTSGEDEPTVSYITLALENVTATVNGVTYNSGIIPVTTGEAAVIALTPITSSYSARVEDGATVSAPVAFTGANGTETGSYIVTVAVSSDFTLTCTAKKIQSDEVLSGIEINYCTLPASGVTGTYNIYLGEGSPVATYNDLRDYISVRTIYKRDGVQTRTEEITSYTIDNAASEITVSSLYAVLTVRFDNYSAMILLNEVDDYGLTGAAFYLDGKAIEGTTVSLYDGTKFASLINTGRLTVQTTSDMFGTKWAKRSWVGTYDEDKDMWKDGLFSASIQLGGTYSVRGGVDYLDGYNPACRFYFGGYVTEFTLNPLERVPNITVVQSGTGYSIEELNGATSGTVEAKGGFLELVINITSGYTSDGTFTVTKNGETLTNGVTVSGDDASGYALSISGLSDGDSITVALTTEKTAADDITLVDGVLTISALVNMPTQTSTFLYIT